MVKDVIAKERPMERLKQIEDSTELICPVETPTPMLSPEPKRIASLRLQCRLGINVVAIIPLSY